MNDEESSAVLHCIHYSAVTQKQLDYLFSSRRGENEIIVYTLEATSGQVILPDQKTI